MDLIRQMGVEVEVNPLGNLAYAKGRRTPTFRNPRSQCYMALMVNGVRVADWDLNKYQVSQFDGIEIYRRSSEMPVQYTATGNDCGVIVLWSRGF